MLQAGLDGPPGGGDWFSAEEPVGVGGAVLDSLELAEDNVKVRGVFLLYPRRFLRTVDLID